MKTLICTFYYNASHWIDLQYRSFKAFIPDSNFIIIDDSDIKTTALLSGKNAREEIKSECNRLGLKHISIPQNVHLNVKHGGLVPDGLTASHPTERHRSTVHYFLANHKAITEGYDYLMFGESDMLARKSIIMPEYIGENDILGTGRTNEHKIRNLNKQEFWPESLPNDVIIDFYTMYCTIVNLKTVKNLEDLNVGGFAGTDTGGKSSVFIRQNPQYKYGFLHIFNNTEHQVDLFSKFAPEKDDDAEIVHFRGGGSNWDYQSKEYHKEKLKRMLKRYVPSLYDGTPEIHGIKSRDREHTF